MREYYLGIPEIARLTDYQIGYLVEEDKDTGSQDRPEENQTIKNPVVNFQDLFRRTSKANKVSIEEVREVWDREFAKEHGEWDPNLNSERMVEPDDAA